MKREEEVTYKLTEGLSRLSPGGYSLRCCPRFPSKTYYLSTLYSSGVFYRNCNFVVSPSYTMSYRE
jgi:hypothetical protein